jgi:hypothetical protein
MLVNQVSRILQPRHPHGLCVSSKHLAAAVAAVVLVAREICHISKHWAA